MIKAPQHLSKEAQKIWQSINESYEMETQHQVTLQIALEFLDRMREAQASIKKYGVMIYETGKMPRINPACKVEKDAASAMLAYWRSMGLDLEPILDQGRPPGK